MERLADALGVQDLLIPPFEFPMPRARGGGRSIADLERTVEILTGLALVSYTHLTLPTKVTV